MCSKSLIQYLLMGGAVFPAAIYLRPNYVAGNEDNGNLAPSKDPRHVMLQSMPPQKPCRRPPSTHAFAGDSQTPTGKSPVGSLFLSPRSWCTKFCHALQESISQSCVSSGRSIVGLMATTSKRAYAIPTPRAPFPVADHCQAVPPQEMLKHSSVSVSVGSLCPGAHMICLNPLRVSGRNRV